MPALNNLKETTVKTKRKKILVDIIRNNRFKTIKELATALSDELRKQQLLNEYENKESTFSSKSTSNYINELSEESVIMKDKLTGYYVVKSDYKKAEYEYHLLSTLPSKNKNIDEWFTKMKIGCLVNNEITKDFLKEIRLNHENIYYFTRTKTKKNFIYLYYPAELDLEKEYQEYIDNIKKNATYYEFINEKKR